ncbi:hypothetical protein NMY22_g141 [Coprinellus aureogranulatus]|nr:hypothetical protein NMY22_g141 [Coprinellus aureogranulatus]
MLSLPPELQLEVIKLLDASDVLVLVIWKECLRRHCRRNQLFWPSYSHLSTVPEYKRAIAAPSRFTESYLRSAQTGEVNHMSSTETTLQLEAAQQGLEESGNFLIRYIHLIRGGRFLLTGIDEHLEIWDLQSPPAVKSVLRHHIGRFDYVAYTNSPTPMKQQYIWSTREVLPEAFAQSVQDNDHYTANRWGLAELVYCGETFAVKRYDFVLVYPSSILDIADGFNIITSDGKVVFQFYGVTVLWDYLQSTFASWRLDGASDYMELFLVDDHLVYISETGARGILISDCPNQTPMEGGFVDLGDQQPPVLTPSFTLPHEVPYNFSRWDVLAPDICRPFDENKALIYDIKVHREAPDGRASPPELHRYGLILDAKSPTHSTLQRMGVFVCTHPKPHIDIPLSMFASYHQRCNGRLGFLWCDHLALSDRPQFVGTSFSNRYQADSNLRFVPLHAPTSRRRRLFTVSFCPASSKAVGLLRERQENGPHVGLITTSLILYEFM